MALGALQSETEKTVRDLEGALYAGHALPLPEQVKGAPLGIAFHIGLQVGVLRHHPADFIRPCFRRLAFPTGRQENALNHLIVREVLFQADPQPVIKTAGVCRLFDSAVAIGSELGRLEDVAELHRPHPRMAGPLQELVDLAGPLVRPLVNQEGSDFVGGGQLARHIQANPTKEGSIVAAFSGMDVQPLEFVEDVLVEEVSRGHLGEGFLAGTRHRDHAHHRLGAIAHQQGRVADAVTPNCARFIYRRHISVERLERCQLGDVLDRTIREGGPDSQGKRRTRLDGLLGRVHFQVFDVGWRKEVERRPAGNPAPQYLVLGAAEDRSSTALVRYAAGRFLKKEAGVRFVQVESAAAIFADQTLVVQGRVRPEQGEAKAIFPLDGPVTDASIATETTQHRNHMTAKPGR